MTFRLLWSIVRVNFRKNWVMILSFFAFLLISFSIVFGLTSFAVGLHNEMPAQVMAAQKYVTKFDTNSIGWNPTKPANNEIGVGKYRDEVKREIRWTFKRLIKPEEASNVTDDFMEWIVDGDRDFSGSLQGALIKATTSSKSKYSDEQHIDMLEEAENSLLKVWSNTNLVSYVLATKIFPKYFGNMNIWNWNRAFWRPYGNRNSESFYILSKNNNYQKSLMKSAVYETAKYLGKDNVLILSPNAEKVYKYKLGQKVEISGSDHDHLGLPKNVRDIKQEFIYGGTGAFLNTMPANQWKDWYKNYIINYEPENGSDFRKAYNNQHDTFYIQDRNSGASKQGQFDYIHGIATKNIFAPSDSQDGWMTDAVIFQSYIVYIGMAMFSVVVGIILVVLDIVVAVFLIREIIRSLGTQLLFLKTLGMTNNEASWITTVTLSAIMILSLGLSLLGMLGIQALFINITSGFLADFNNWFLIKAFSWVIIAGIAILLFAIYAVSTIIMLNRIDLTSNSIFAKAGTTGKALRGKLFDISVNSGLTFSFAMKNLKKIIATFCITVLITMLSFIALGFKTAMDRGIDQERQFTSYKDTLSWQAADGWNNYPDSDKDAWKFNDSNASQTITYQDKKATGNDSLQIGDTPIDLSERVTGKYLTRDNFGKLIKKLEKGDFIKTENSIPEVVQTIGSVLENEWDSYKKEYDSTIRQMWPSADNNFKINLGTLFTGGYEHQTAYQLNTYLQNGHYDGGKLIVLDDNSDKAKEIFKNNYKYAVGSVMSQDVHKGGNFLNVVPYLPVTVGSNYAANDQISEGDLSGDSNIDFHIIGKSNVPLEGKPFAIPNNGGVWPNRDLLRLKYNTSTRISDPKDAYVKKSDFVRYLQFCANKDGNYKNDPENNAIGFFNKLLQMYSNNEEYNAFLGNGVPIIYKQLVIPRRQVEIDYSNSTSDPEPVPLKILNDDQTLGSYLVGFHYLFGTDQIKNNQVISYYKLSIDEKQNMLMPIENAMIVLLILIICLAFAFIIFMVMSIMNENDDIIFILKALGYEKIEILWRMVAGYILSIVISVFVGTIIAGVILTIMNTTFIQILYLGIMLKISGSVAGLFIALAIGLPLCISAVAWDRIGARNLTTLDNE